MKCLRSFWTQLIAGIFLAAPLSGGAQSDESISLSITNGIKYLQLPLVSGVDAFEVLTSTDLTAPFTPTAGVIDGYNWTAAGQKDREFFAVRMTPKDSNAVVSATLLNRLAYGPTPDELNRVAQLTPQAYIQEQLAPEQITESLPYDQIHLTDDWQFVTQTGTASSSTLYIYLDGAGDCYIDDLKLVAGSVAEVGQNRIRNGSFDVTTTSWVISPNLSNSVVTATVTKIGAGSLHLISTEAGESRGTSIYQENLGLSDGATYTLSYWYKPGTNRSASPTLRLSGSGIQSSPGTLATRLALGSARLQDLRAWHVLHAVESRKQLLEVLLQFWENHFVTQHRKSADYFDGLNLDEEDAIATNLEYREIERWRAALLNPQCTFHDLLKISAESPAMIIYLDTVNSKGNGGNIANENYARELLELFTFGVDNGYDQNDITQMSKAWTGWSVRLVDPADVFNPFAPQSITLRPGGTNISQINNLMGTWAFAYKANNHSKGPVTIFPGKTVPPRFGPPYAGKNYQLKLPINNEAAGDWQYVTMTGTATAQTLYIYLSAAGDCYIDDLKLVAGMVPEAGPNLIRNGTFDADLSEWTVAANMNGSRVVTDTKKEGAGSLRVVASSAGSSSGSSIRQGALGLTLDAPYTLSYWYKPGADAAAELTIRLSGRGIDSSPGGGTNRIEDGYAVLTHLADQPFTQEFMSVKLCRLFVHEDFHTGYDFTDGIVTPEEALIRDCMRAWEENVPKGQIRRVLEVIFNSELFRTQTASMQKVKTPFEFAVSAVRALRGDAGGTLTAETDGYALYNPMNRAGRMRLFDRDDPDGYPEAGAPWISAGTLAERLRFVQSFLLPRNASGREPAGNNYSDPVRLLKARLPQAQWNNAAAVAEFFAGIIYPAEGRANLGEYRRQAEIYLNEPSGVTGDTSAAVTFATISNTSTGYDYRVRGMVALLLTHQRFQEQ